MFDAKGNLYVAVGPFGEVVRINRAELNPAQPGVGETFATGVPGANSIAFDKLGYLYVSGGVSGITHRIGSTGDAAQAVAQIKKMLVPCKSVRHSSPS